jgi:hypothetical protein
MTTAKPRTPRKTPVKPAAELPSVVDQMGEDAALPTEYPPGVPELRPLLDVRPRGRRAEFKRLLAKVAERSPELQREQQGLEGIKSVEAREVASLRLWASMDDLFEVIEEALRLVAVDPGKFDTWVAEASDEDLQIAWAVYQQRTQPGEASSSTS